MKNNIDVNFYNVYTGILINNNEFKSETAGNFTYDFNCEEYKELLAKYDIVKIAGKGDTFTRAIRVLHYFSSRLFHSPWYDNHIECNSLKLLEYSFNNKEQGINCLNKSKILSEIYLALGIYARRVYINPYTPYDMDSHVVVEVFINELNKWVMVDPTTDGYFIDENRNPLGILEIRRLMENQSFITFINSNSRAKDLAKLEDANYFNKMYFSKNIFRITIDAYNGFGESPNKDKVFFTPKGFNIFDNQNINLKYRMDNLPKEYEYLKNTIFKALDSILVKEEPLSADISLLEKSPIE